jgi:hypothetical protein
MQQVRDVSRLTGLGVENASYQIQIESSVFFVKSAGIGRPSPLVAGRPILSATPRRGTDCRDAIAD